MNHNIFCVYTFVLFILIILNKDYNITIIHIKIKSKKKLYLSHVQILK